MPRSAGARNHTGVPAGLLRRTGVTNTRKGVVSMSSVKSVFVSIGKRHNGWGGGYDWGKGHSWGGGHGWGGHWGGGHGGGGYGWGCKK